MDSKNAKVGPGEAWPGSGAAVGGRRYMEEADTTNEVYPGGRNTHHEFPSAGKQQPLVPAHECND